MTKKNLETKKRKEYAKTCRKLWKAVTVLCAKLIRPLHFFYMLFSFRYVLPYWIMCSLGIIMSTFRLDERSFNLILRSLYLIMCTSHFVILSYFLVVCSYHLLRRSFYLVIRSSHSVMCFFMRSF